MRSRRQIATIVCAGLLTASFALAGQGQGAAKKAPDQGPQSGHLDDATVEVGGQQVHLDPVTGQIRQPTAAEVAALAATLDRQFGKRGEGVVISSLAGGGVKAQLDESFAEAMTVTKRPDGSLAFGHAPNAAAKATPKARRGAAVAKGASKPTPTTSAAPELEQK